MSLHRSEYRRGPRPPAARLHAAGGRLACPAGAGLAPAALPRLAPGRRALQRGLTLVELAVTLAVLVVLVSMASPGMSDFTANNQLSATKSAFAAGLALARSEAARRGQPVLLVAVTGGPTGNAWGRGWEVVADEDGDGLAGNGETRVRRQAALDSRVRLDGPVSLRFLASGALGGGSDQVFRLCRSDGASRGFRITVTPSGSADVAQDGGCV